MEKEKQKSNGLLFQEMATANIYMLNGGEKIEQKAKESKEKRRQRRELKETTTTGGSPSGAVETGE